MDFQQLAIHVPFLIGNYMEGASAPVQVVDPLPGDTPSSWRFTFGDAIAVVAIAEKSLGVRVTAGVAKALPFGPDALALVNSINRDELTHGRAFLLGNEERGLGAIVLQEFMFGEFILEEAPVTSNIFLKTLITVVGTAGRLAGEICAPGGPEPFEETDDLLLASS